MERGLPCATCPLSPFRGSGRGSQGSRSFSGFASFFSPCLPWAQGSWAYMWFYCHGCWSLSIGRQDAVMPSMSTPSPLGKGVAWLTARSYNHTTSRWNLAHHPSAVWPWGRHMTSLGLSFLGCKQRMTLIPGPWGRCEGAWKCPKYSRHQIRHRALLITVPAVDCLLTPSAYSSSIAQLSESPDQRNLGLCTQDRRLR